MTETTTETESFSDETGPRFDVNQDYDLTVDGLEMSMILAALEMTAEDAVIAILSGDTAGIHYMEPLLRLVDKLRNTK